MAPISKIGVFLENYPLLQYAPNRTVFDVDSLPGQALYLEDGLVREFITTSDGFSVTVHIHTKGSFFPYYRYHDKSDISTSFETIVPSQIRSVPIEKLHDYIRSDSELLESTVCRMSAYIGKLSRQLEILIGGSALQKTSATLINLSQVIGRPVGEKGYLMIDFPFTHRDLSTWTGTARETTSINLKILEKKGIIKYLKRRIVIRKIEILKELAGG